MLDVHLSPTLAEITWQQLDQTAQLPCSTEKFFAVNNKFTANSRRRFERIFFRGRACLYHKKSTLGVYTIDLSPSGMGFYGPVQLLPKTQVILQFDQYDPLQLVAMRCRRVGEMCYRCGTRFLTGPLSTIPYRNLIRQLEG